MVISDFRDSDLDIFEADGFSGKGVGKILVEGLTSHVVFGVFPIQQIHALVANPSENYFKIYISSILVYGLDCHLPEPSVSRLELRRNCQNLVHVAYQSVRHGSVFINAEADHGHRRYADEIIAQFIVGLSKYGELVALIPAVGVLAKDLKGKVGVSPEFA